MNHAQRSILQMARGAILERADYEMARIIENIMDANTAPAAKRKLTLTLEFKPDAERQVIQVSCAAKLALVPTNPVVTSVYVADGANVVEMAPQVPGQVDIAGGEQKAPAVLKVVNFRSLPST